MIALPAKGTDEGVETRVLLAECRGPSFSGYALSTATRCMQLMDVVLWNRRNNPGPFGAKNASSLADIIRAPGQFAGFRNYPNYDAAIVKRIQAMIDIANSTKDKRSSAFTDFINAAMAVARSPTITDQSPGTLASWRTAGSTSPGPGFTKYTTIGGNDFYYM